MDFIESFDLFGVDAKQIPSITGEGAPTSVTKGAVGCFYMDTLSGEVYKCIAVNGEEFVWGILSESNLNGKVNLPKDSEGNIQTGTIGQFAISDGNGGITWQTIAIGNEVAY